MAPACEPGALDAVILAAGLSSRMDGFKPLYPLGNGTVLGQAIALFQDAGVREVLVVSGHNGAAVDAAARAAGARPVRNHAFASGMFTSVQAGAAALRPDAAAFLLLPVDIPLVRPATVRALLAAWRGHARLVTHPTFRGTRGHPPLVAALLREAIIRWTGPRGLRGLLDTLEARASYDVADVPVADAGILHDMDTEADYARLAARWSQRDLPSREECAALLRLAGTPALAVAHGQAVAKVAVAVAEALNRHGAGPSLDSDRIDRAALLHDVAKGDAHHEAAGAALLDAHGFPAIGAIVAAHRDIPPHPERPLDEADVVFMADKLVAGVTLVPIEARYGQVLERHGHDPVARAAIEGRLANALAMRQRMEAVTAIPLTALAAQALEA
ncbi:MAG: DVU_1551 family NTP transferase [Desulfovibrionaceae bacterium]